ncbi:hypothetical protein RCO27_00145 [Sphingosinicella sp. LHD-64]|uniref:hypothetical protein n=1 Tax=Sphingosinicella sp. LHD-64 TaxID=3072139 RepID=UPI00280D8641|nr:hypothetical protein [Sphingosinicella sp. LHD-64]MDQ8754629.1 hypothetical protein [Sphingosinicella sp. LHD-64]
MNRTVIVMAALLGAAGCNMASEEDRLENSIREELGKQGTVQEVNLTRQDENNMVGYATIREHSGRSGRLNCTAQRTEGANFNWRCSPAIDQAVLDEMEGQIRTQLAQQADVAEVSLERAGDDNHMAGYVVVREGGGETRVPCTAERTEGANFSWRCGEETETGGAK